MESITLFMMSALLCVVSFSAVFCGDDKVDNLFFYFPFS